jgi:hypothetical protein
MISCARLPCALSVSVFPPSVSSRTMRHVHFCLRALERERRFDRCRMTRHLVRMFLRGGVSQVEERNRKPIKGLISEFSSKLIYEQCGSGLTLSGGEQKAKFILASETTD